MKFAFFPGCVSRGGCPELYPATIKVCQKLGFDLDELQKRGATCTGAGVLQEKNLFLGDVLNARTFAIAESLNLPITLQRNPESVVYQKLWQLNWHLRVFVLT